LKIKIYIALFRGINVGGGGILRMKDLTALLEKLGLHDVRTYIQSGNVVFRANQGNANGLAQRIRTAVNQEFHLDPHIIILEKDDLVKALKVNPFPEAESEPKTLHLFFLNEAPAAADWEALKAIKTDREQFELKGKVFYLYAPDGLGWSKLAMRAEKLLGVSATARNWRTVSEIIKLADQYES
jgi:uncharacterized protein (DUF1697 family)